MINVSNTFKTAQSASVRTPKGKVELYNGSTLLGTYTQSDYLQEIEIQRVAESGKFFGLSVCQRINVKLCDVDRELSPVAGYTLKVYLGFGSEYVGYPDFTISEVYRDETTNQLSITGYDFIKQTASTIFEEITISAPYTIKELADAIATYFNTTVEVRNVSDSVFSTSYTDGGNFEGTETLRSVLDDICEATQTICFVNYQNKLVFKRLTTSETTAATITKSDYIELDSSENKRLKTIASITELGDNVSASILANGSTQYFRDNALLELRTDIQTMLDNAISIVGGLTINQFELKWFGNLSLEIGDKIAITTRDNSTVNSYILNDTVTYNGALIEESEWSFDNDEEIESNPTSIGDALNKTYARVDKANKSIELLVSSDAEQSAELSTLKLEQNSISASVSQQSTTIDNALTDIYGELDSVKNSVDTKMTSQEVTIAINQALENDVTSVTTKTGFTFNSDGLTISKAGSEMETNIDEDGMTVSRDGTEVLVANNDGVDAINLTAHQYLIVGLNSRFEDYDNNRTGCFYIGG